MKRILLIVLLIAFVFIYASDLRLFDQAKDFYNSGEYAKAGNLLQIVSEDIKAKPEYHKLLAQVYIAQQKFELAYEEYSLYQEGNLGIDHRRINKIKEVLKKDADREQEQNVIQELSYILGDVNSTNSDFAPVFSQDKKKMYYTSLKPANYAAENIWVAEYSNGIWTNSKVINSLSSNLNESIGCFSQDGKTAYLFGNYQGSDKGDIFISNLTGQKWSKPENINIVNSEYTEMQPYVFDKIMFFASNRPEGFGGFDLYVSEFKGYWTDPVNLGTVINTKLDEETPFLDWDGKTLYFASNGHPGLGELDVFRSKIIGNTWQDWSEPENMGVIINSVRNDRCFNHSKNDNNWYLSSDRVGGRGFEDIYRVFITDKIPGTEQVTIVFGKVTANEGYPLTQQQILFRSQDSTVERTVTTDSEGKFNVSLAGNETYKYFLDREGFSSLSDFIEIKGMDTFELNLVLEALKEDIPIEIEDIFFDFDKATLRSESFPALDLLTRTLQVNFKLQAEISGHTDSSGSDEYNMQLSKDRAASVVNYLTQHGIDQSRLTSIGYGESQPIDTNETEEGRQNNRRVEMEVKEM